LENETEYRFFTPPPEGRGEIRQGDARIASRLFPKLMARVTLVITSPPYLDTTNTAEDQWLRLWFLGGPERPLNIRADNRHTSTVNYWRFLQEAWAGISDLLRPDARLIIRIGGARLSVDEIGQGLKASLEAGLSRQVSSVEQRTSMIAGGQVRSFQTNATGARFEYDFHFQLA
jgi:hypothetical protein